MVSKLSDRIIQLSVLGTRETTSLDFIKQGSSPHQSHNKNRPSFKGSLKTGEKQTSILLQPK